MFRELLRGLCAAEGVFDNVLVAETGKSAIEQIECGDIDLIIVDPQLPDWDGFDFTDKVRRSFPNLRILMLSSACDDYTLYRVDQIKVHGFVHKGSDCVDSLREAICDIIQGRTYFSAAFQDGRRMRIQNQSHFLKVLSDRECAVLQLVGQAFSDTEIAERLKISESTAQTYRSHIMRKLQLRGTPQLMHFALRNGLSRIGQDV